MIPPALSNLYALAKTLRCGTVLTRRGRRPMFAPPFTGRPALCSSASPCSCVTPAALCIFRVGAYPCRNVSRGAARARPIQLAEAAVACAACCRQLKAPHESAAVKRKRTSTIPPSASQHLHLLHLQSLQGTYLYVKCRRNIFKCPIPGDSHKPRIQGAHSTCAGRLHPPGGDRTGVRETSGWASGNV